MTTPDGYFAGLYEAVQANGGTQASMDEFVADQEAMVFGVFGQTMLEEICLPYIEERDTSWVREEMRQEDTLVQVPSVEGAEVSFKFADIRVQMLMADMFINAQQLTEGRVVATREKAPETEGDRMYVALRAPHGGGPVVRGVLESVGQQAGRARVVRCDLLAQSRRRC